MTASGRDSKRLNRGKWDSLSRDDDAGGRAWMGLAAAVLNNLMRLVGNSGDDPALLTQQLARHRLPVGGQKNSRGFYSGIGQRLKLVIAAGHHRIRL